MCEEVLEKPSLANDQRVVDNVARLANREFLDKEIEDVLYKITRDEVRKRLIAAKIAFGAVNTIEDVSDHPALKTIKINTPKGTIDVMAPPSSVKGEAVPLLSVPEVGENNDSIRAEFQ